VLVACIMMTFVRNLDWSDDVTLNISRYELWNNAYGRRALGTLLYEKGEVDQALEALLDAVEMDPSSAEVQRKVGIIYAQKGRSDLARPYLEKSFELEPDCEKNDALRALLN